MLILINRFLIVDDWAGDVVSLNSMTNRIIMSYLCEPQSHLTDKLLPIR